MRRATRFRSASWAMRPRCCPSTSRNIRPDALTDQISAHDLVNGYLPEGWSVERWWGVRNGGVDA